MISQPATRGNMQRLGMNLGWSSDLMCGNFDLKSTIGNQLNGVTDGFKSLMGNVIQGATGAVASLPAMAIQRANPGLYEMLTNGVLQANVAFDKAQLNCQNLSKRMMDTIETAFIMRRMITTGMSEPNASAQKVAMEEGDRRIEALDREITALKNEMEMKREIARNAVLTIIDRENNRAETNPQRQSVDSPDTKFNQLAVPESDQ